MGGMGFPSASINNNAAVNSVADDSKGFGSGSRVPGSTADTTTTPFFGPAQAREWCRRHNAALTTHAQPETGSVADVAGGRSQPSSASSFTQATALPIAPDLLPMANFLIQQQLTQATVPGASEQVLEQLHHYQLVLKRMSGVVQSLGAQVASLGIQNSQLVC